MLEVLALLRKPCAHQYLIMSLFSGASGRVEKFWNLFQTCMVYCLEVQTENILRKIIEP